MVLSDIDIRDAMRLGDLVIDPPPDKIDSASVDLRVGKEGWGGVEGRRVGSRQPQKIDIAENKIIRIPRGSIIAILIFETLKLSTRISATYGLRSRYAREGLILLSGPQIAPGFKGRLTATIFNAGTREFELSFEEPFATLVVSWLKTPALKGYDGRYQGQEGVSPEEVKAVTREHFSFDQIEHALRELRNKYDTIWSIFLYVLTGTIAGILAGIVVTLLLLFFKSSPPILTSNEEMMKRLTSLDDKVSKLSKETEELRNQVKLLIPENTGSKGTTKTPPK